MPATAAAPAPVPAALRWTGALAVVLALHGGAAWLLLSRTIAPIGPPPVPEAVMLDLAPDLPPSQPATIVPPAPAAAPPPIPAPAPPPAPTPEPPAPEPPTPQTLQTPQPDLPPLDLPATPPVAAEVELPVPPPPPPTRPQPKPKPKPPVRRIERQAAPPIDDIVERPIQPVAPTPAPVQAAPRPPATAAAIPTIWRNDLLSRLQRAKRYPDLARSRGDQGVATVSFTMDRAGRVLAVTLVRSSGSSLLDEEAAALVRRAEPLPRLPDEIAGATLTLTVPISFALR